MNKTTLLLFIQRYISSRYHSANMHMSQMAFLQDMILQLSQNLYTPKFIKLLKEAIESQPKSAVALFGNRFLKFR